jgi:hypothetical protein
MVRIVVVPAAFAVFNLLTLTTPTVVKQNLNAWASFIGRR